MKCGVITHSRQQKQQWGGGWGGGEVGYNFKKQGRQNGGGGGLGTLCQLWLSLMNNWNPID